MNVKRYKVAFDTGVIPASGYKIFKVDRENKCSREGVEWSDQWARTSDILKAPNVMENEHLRVQVNTNGSFDLKNKENGKVYHNLNYYEDHGEHGNYWANERPHKDRAYNSLGANAKLLVEASGPLFSTIVSEVTMEIPKQGDFENRSRGNDLSPLTIKTFYTLKAGSRQVDVKVEFENRHKDHCLRAMLPTGIVNASHAVVGEHFNAHSRAIRPQGPDSESYWQDMGRLPCDGFVDISDGQEGLAVINDCLTEYEVSNTEERVMALTLLRSVRNSICTELRVWSSYPSQDGGQCFGEHKVHYAICPHCGSWDDVAIDLKAQLFNAPVRVVQTNKHTGAVSGSEISLFSVSNPKVRFSALKKAERSDNIIVRLYNPTSKTQDAAIEFNSPVSKAWHTNLNEDRQSEVNVSSAGVVDIEIEPKKIYTLELDLK